MDRGLRRRRVAPRGQLPERQGGVPRRAAGRPLQTVRQSLERARCSERSDRLQLPLRRPARAHEIRVVRVCESVRLRARGGDDRPLLEREHRVSRAGGGKDQLDPVQTLRVRDGMTPTVEDAEPSAGGGPDRAQELRALPARRCAARGAESAGPRASPRRAGRRAGRRRGSTNVRRRAWAAARAAHAAQSARPPRRASQARAGRPRRAAGSASRDRTRAGGRCGSPSGCRARGGA